MIILVILLLILLLNVYSHINESYIILKNPKLPNDIQKYQQSKKNLNMDVFLDLFIQV